MAETKATMTQAAELAGNFRDLQKLANEQYNQLADTVEDKSSLEAVPALNEELLEAIESVAKDDEKSK